PKLSFGVSFADAVELVLCLLFLYSSGAHPHLHSFPTRRSSDLEPADVVILDLMLPDGDGLDICRQMRARSDSPILMLTARGDPIDRKSTRLNSSHLGISYAVFCLKKKTKTYKIMPLSRYACLSR